MPNYKKMYVYMFNGITEAIKQLEKIKKSPNAFALASLSKNLKQLQIDCEKMYIDTYAELPEDFEEEGE